jgi:oxygen-independent coproporphyrinogen III oxidase
MNIELIKKYNKPGPRYTSYPPANFFSTKFTEDNYIQAIKNSNRQLPESISLYIHIPFCPRLCHFCGCNTSIFKSRDFIERYISCIIAEMRTVSALLDKKRLVSQIHWGGGTPNSIPLDFVKRIMDEIKILFQFTAKPEIAMECSPAYLDYADIDELAAMGFNRLSLGVQDFNIKVLDIVNRSQSKHPVEKLVQKMKEAGMEGVNIDLIYGLPGQTPESFEETIRRAIAISPDRIVTFSYAHVPWVKSAQKILEEAGLPSTEDKLKMFDTAYQLLTQNGYLSIGMDHYAKPGDELSIALENKKLHRNFQGYCTKETTGQVYGFGASSISQLHGAYIQNHKDTEKYMTSIEEKGLAVERGYQLSDLDIYRRRVINEVMCNGYLNFDELAAQFNISVTELIEAVAFNPDKFSQFIADGLMDIENHTVKLRPEGFTIVRNIAMEFDPMLQTSENMYSKTV